MIKKILIYIGYSFRYIVKVKLNRRVGAKYFVKIQSNVRLKVEKKGKLVFGKNVMLKNNTIIYVKRNSTIILGNNSSTGHHTEISAGNFISVGDNVLMAAYTYITDSNHTFSQPNIPIRQQGMSIGSVRIGNNVWLGRNVSVLKDAEIGDNSVVAASSVVVGKFGRGQVLGGIPAKKIKPIN